MLGSNVRSAGLETGSRGYREPNHYDLEWRGTMKGLDEPDMIGLAIGLLVERLVVRQHNAATFTTIASLSLSVGSHMIVVRLHVLPLDNLRHLYRHYIFDPPTPRRSALYLTS